MLIITKRWSEERNFVLGFIDIVIETVLLLEDDELPALERGVDKLFPGYCLDIDGLICNEMLNVFYRRGPN